MKSNLYCILTIIFTALVVSSCSSVQQGMLRGSGLLSQSDQLINKLNQGGYVIYFNHARTNLLEKDTDTRNLENCETQRNLSDRGRSEAESIGEAFLAMQIPVALVYASPYCRSMETGKIGVGKASRTFDLKGIKSTERQESERRINVLFNMLATTPPAEKNTILISHPKNIEKAAGYTSNDGDAIVFLPLEENGFTAIAYITSGQWKDMARSLNMLK